MSDKRNLGRRLSRVASDVEGVGELRPAPDLDRVIADYRRALKAYFEKKAKKNRDLSPAELEPPTWETWLAEHCPDDVDAEDIRDRAALRRRVREDYPGQHLAEAARRLAEREGGAAGASPPR